MPIAFFKTFPRKIHPFYLTFLNLTPPCFGFIWKKPDQKCVDLSLKLKILITKHIYRFSFLDIALKKQALYILLIK